MPARKPDNLIAFKDIDNNVIVACPALSVEAMGESYEDAMATMAASLLAERAKRRPSGRQETNREVDVHLKLGRTARSILSKLASDAGVPDSVFIETILLRHWAALHPATEGSTERLSNSQ